jgi:hypothetical protein
MVWQNVDLQNGATVDFRSVTVNGLVDDEHSWPLPGGLAIDGFVYRDFASPKIDVNRRLRWVALSAGKHPTWMNAPEGFRTQPYRELAKVLRERGDDSGATTVLIVEEDLRHAQMGVIGRAWGHFLNWTIGYGHRPLRAILWSVLVVTLGAIVVGVGKRAGLMRLTWPENSTVPEGNPTSGLSPLLYSLDVFLPFVNLHQEHYWWPDESASGECSFLGRPLLIGGNFLRAYLWVQIIAGWLLSAIFVAGVTGLIRND